MTAKIVAFREGKAVLAGLNWDGLLEPKQRAAEIRASATLHGAQKVVVVESEAGAAVGCYAVSEDGLEFPGGEVEPKVKQLHSLAAAFAGVAGVVPSVLGYVLPDTVTAVVVVVVGGAPILDAIKPVAEAQSLLSIYANGSDGVEHAVYTNDFGMFGEGSSFDADAVWAAIGKSTTLTPKPANVVGLIATVGFLVVAGAGAFLYQEHAERERKAELARQAAAADPRPQYEQAWAIQSPQIGWTSSQVRALVSSVYRTPVLAAGWELKSVLCTSDSGMCVSTWGRKGGTTEGLMALRAPLGETIAPESTQNSLLLQVKVDMPRSGVTSIDQLPSMATWSNDYASLFQQWSNAEVDLKVAADGYKTWPEVPGVDVSRVPGAAKVLATEMQSSAVLVDDALKSAPNNIFWREVTLKPDINSDSASDLLKISLKGGIYVH